MKGGTDSTHGFSGHGAPPIGQIGQKLSGNREAAAGRYQSLGWMDIHQLLAL